MTAAGRNRTVARVAAAYAGACLSIRWRPALLGQGRSEQVVCRRPHGRNALDRDRRAKLLRPWGAPTEIREAAYSTRAANGPSLLDQSLLYAKMGNSLRLSFGSSRIKYGAGCAYDLRFACPGIRRNDEQRPVQTFPSAGQSGDRQNLEEQPSRAALYEGSAATTLSRRAPPSRSCRRCRRSAPPCLPAGRGRPRPNTHRRFARGHYR